MSLGRLEPRVIGATGGSGTRVVGRIVRAGGMFIGTNLNDYQDALDLAGFSDRWINGFVASGGLAGLAPETRRAMEDDLAASLEEHRRPLPSTATAWGWKEPRSIYLVSFFDQVMPEFRFLHFMRDGRDMAFSDNQQQLRKHGDVVLSGIPRWKKRLRSIALWSEVNTKAADFGERHMPGRYLRVRFEDLCAEPVETVRRLYDFFGLEGDVEAAAAEVRPPGTLGRWRRGRKRTLEELHEVAGPALERFGYLAPA
jgi:hypothetical protein